MNSFRWGAFAAAASIVIYQCFVPPIVGLADNADFLIVASRLSLDVSNPDDPDRYYRFLNNHYYYSDEPAWVPSVLTSEILLVLPGYLASRVLSKTGHYDIRWAGITHAAIFLLGIYWILPLVGRLGRRGRRVAAGVMIFILTDVVYVSYFNTLYTDAASLVTLIALLAGIVRFASGYDRSRRLAVSIFALAVLFASSKVQHFILGLPVLALLGWYRGPLKDALGGWPRFAAGMAAIAATMGIMAATTAPRYSGMALYNVVFFHLLPKAPDPAAALRELGLPEKYVVHSGTHSFSEGSAVLQDEQFQKEWQQLASFGMLLRYYVRHPGLTLGMLGMGLEESRIYRTMYGNFLKDSGYFAFTRSSAFSVWSWAKQYFLGPPARSWKPDIGYWPHLAFTFLPALFLLWSMHSGRFAALHAAGRPAAYAVIAMALATMAVSSLSDVRETFRHLFLYNALLDVIFIAAASVACYGWRRKPDAA